MPRLLLTLSLIIPLLLTEEAHVSVIAETVDLETVVRSSSFIFISKPREHSQSQVYEFSFLRALKGKAELKAAQTFKVHPANAELHAQIAEMQKRGDPTPMPIISRYGSSLPDLTSAKEVILLLSQNSKGEFRLTMEGSFESTAKLSEIERLVAKHKTN